MLPKQPAKQLAAHRVAPLPEHGKCFVEPLRLQMKKPGEPGFFIVPPARWKCAACAEQPMRPAAGQGSKQKQRGQAQKYEKPK